MKTTPNLATTQHSSRHTQPYVHFIFTISFLQLVVKRCRHFLVISFSEWHVSNGNRGAGRRNMRRYCQEPNWWLYVNLAMFWSVFPLTLSNPISVIIIIHHGVEKKNVVTDWRGNKTGWRLRVPSSRSSKRYSFLLGEERDIHLKVGRKGFSLRKGFSGSLYISMCTSLLSLNWWISVLIIIPTNKPWFREIWCTHKIFYTLPTTQPYLESSVEKQSVYY